MAAVVPRPEYTRWHVRVLAALIDCVPIAVLAVVAWAVLLVSREHVCFSDDYVGKYCGTGPSTFGLTSFGICSLLVFTFVIWNYGYKQGTTGSSIGKGIMKFKVVSEPTGQPVGFGMSVVRQLAHFVDGIICYLGFLLPLWDAKRQTIADKLTKTVCLPS